MIPADLGDQRALARIEAGQLGADDQVTRVLVVIVVGDRHADVVEHRGRPQQLALAGLGLEQAAASTSESYICSASRATCSTWAMIGLVLHREVAHGGLAHIVEQRLLAVEQRARRGTHRRADRPRSPRCPSKSAELDHRLERDRGGEDDVAASGLDPGDRPALGDGQRGERVDELAHRLRGDHEALDADVGLVGRALGGGREVADRAADADEPRARRPTASRARPASRARASRSRWSSFFLAGPFPGRKCSVSRTAPSGNDSIASALSARDLDELHAAAADLEHRAVGQGRRVDRRDVAVVGLVASGEHLDRDPGLALRPGEEIRLVGRVANRARGDRVD